jgi:hypothetical protein
VAIPLVPRTGRAIDLVVGERCDGPIFLGTGGERIDRHAAGRIVRRIARRAGIAKRVGPHTLRHAFITAALDAGVPLRDVQEAASHADPRTTMRYDRARVSLDRHATYIVATLLAGASRCHQRPALASEIAPERSVCVLDDDPSTSAEAPFWRYHHRATARRSGADDLCSPSGAFRVFGACAEIGSGRHNGSYIP